MRIFLILALSFPVLGFAKTGHVECNYYQRAIDEKGFAHNVLEKEGLKSGAVHSEIVEGQDIGLEGNAHIDVNGFTISAYVQENLLQSIGLIDQKTGAGAFALAYKDGMTVQLYTDSKNLHEIFCKVVHD